LKHAQISIIDDDVATRLALAALMRAKGFDARVYESAEDFLQADNDRGQEANMGLDFHQKGLSCKADIWRNASAEVRHPALSRAVAIFFKRSRSH
jgi:FixJ family two-component response regulator